MKNENYLIFMYIFVHLFYTMERLTIIDVLKKLQAECCGEKAHITILLDYEESEFIFCEDLQKMFPTIDSSELECMEGKEDVVRIEKSHAPYYACLTPLVSKHFRL